MRVAHINLHIDYHSGIVNTRMNEAKAGNEMIENTWDVYIISPDERCNRENINFIKLKMPSFLYNKIENSSSLIFFLVRVISLNFLFFRIKFNMIINKISKKYDIVIVRYNSGDLLGWLFLNKKKVILYPHNKPYEELLLYSKIGAFVEKITSRFHYYGVKNICAESKEILDNEISRSNQSVKGFIFPNGTYVDDKDNLDIKRENIINIVMVSSEYQPWQGLDLLLNSLSLCNENYKLHIVGNVKKAYINLINKNKNIIAYGELNQEDLKKIYRKCDVGIGSLAVYRKNIKQLNSLKVREYYANGLGVYLTYEDPAFPNDFKFLKYEKEVSAKNIIEFTKFIRNFKKSEIRMKSKQYIDYRFILKNIVEQLKNFENSKVI